MSFENEVSDQDSKVEDPSIQQSDLADEDQPRWAPPESQPEPRPTDPISAKANPTSSQSQPTSQPI